MKTDNPIVGINFSKADEFLCKYVDFFATKVPVHTVNNLYIFPLRNLFMDLQQKRHDEAINLLLKTFEEKMGENLKGFYQHIKDVKYFAEAGLLLPTLLRFLENKKTNLIFMGKEKGSSGEMAKMAIYHIPAQIMIVPEKAQHKLKKILVTLDESSFSETVLKMAFDLASKINPQPEITCLYISHLSYFMELEKAIIEGYRSIDNKNIIVKSNEIFEEEKEAFEKFVSDRSRGLNLKINTKIIFEWRFKPYLALMDYLDENETDLLIMGDRSHSGLNISMLGRFTQKIITKNDKVPMLVVK